MQRANFNTTSADAFGGDSGEWTVSGGRLEVAPEVLGGDAVSVLYVEKLLPKYFEMQATINAGKPTGGFKSNAYLIFDYQGPFDFKFAGVNISINKLQMGHRDADGWHVDEQTNARLRPDRDYNLLLSLNGNTATIVVDNEDVFSHAFAPRVDFDGFSYGLNAGMVGIGANNSKARIDNVAVQVLPPEITFEATEEFSDTVADLALTPVTGAWQVTDERFVGTPSSVHPAIGLIDLGLANGIDANSLVELTTVFNTQSVGGVVFDQYPTRFKFATISTDNDQLIIGHFTERKGWSYDSIVDVPAGVDAGSDYELAVSLKGTTVSVSLASPSSAMNLLAIAGHVFNGVVVDGGFGLSGMTGESSFDTLTVKTDDPSLGDQLLAAGMPTKPVDATEALAYGQLESIVAGAMDRWLEAGASLAKAVDLGNVQFQIANLPGVVLGRATADTIVIDATAAGHGWFVDTTPSDDLEFYRRQTELLTSLSESPASRMDLLTVVMHELGHLFGIEHSEGSQVLMTESLEAGVRRLPTSDSLYDDITVSQAPILKIPRGQNGRLVSSTFEAPVDGTETKPLDPHFHRANGVDQAISSMYSWKSPNRSALEQVLLMEEEELPLLEQLSEWVVRSGRPIRSDPVKIFSRR